MATIPSSFTIDQDTTQDGNTFFATILISVTNDSSQPATGGTLTLPSATFTPSNVFASGFSSPSFVMNGSDIEIDLTPLNLSAGQSAQITIQSGETANSATWDNAGTTLEMTGEPVFFDGSDWCSYDIDEIVSKTFVKDGDVIDYNYDKVIYNDTTDGVITLDGIVFDGEIEAVGGGNVTVNASNSALVSDLSSTTQTSGTITLSNELIPDIGGVGNISMVQIGDELRVTISGGTETNPITNVQLADFIRTNSDLTLRSFADRIGNTVTFNYLDLRYSNNAWFAFKEDTFTTLNGDFRHIPKAESASGANDGSGLIFQKRITIDMTTAVFRVDGNVEVARTGGKFHSLIEEASGQTPVVLKNMSTRNDFPTTTRNSKPAEVILQGLTIQRPSGTTSLIHKWYFGNSRNYRGLDEVRNLRLASPISNIFQTFNTNYVTPIVPTFTITGESVDNLVTIDRATYGVGTVSTVANLMSGARKTRYYSDDATFNGLIWNGLAMGNLLDGGEVIYRYSQSFNITDSNNPIDGAKLFITKENQNGDADVFLLPNLEYFPQPNEQEFDLVGSTHTTKLVASARTNSTTSAVTPNAQFQHYKYNAQVRHLNWIFPESVFQGRIYGFDAENGNHVYDPFIDDVIGTLDADVLLSKANIELLTDNLTVSELYQWEKNRWVNNDGGQTPQPLFTLNGDTLITDADLIFDPLKTDAPTYDVATNTYTIGGEITGNVTTTGTVTNPQHVSGIVTDSTGTTGILTLN